MPTKLMMRWDIRPEAEAEYFEFVVSEFIPGVSKLGINEIQAWYTIYGDCEQILVSGITETEDQMRRVLASKDWTRLRDKLKKLVDNFSQKVVRATGGFQL